MGRKRALHAGARRIWDRRLPSATPTARSPRPIGEVAGALGNTPAVCRASYIHPALLEAYAQASCRLPPGAACAGLDRWESALLRFLRRVGARGAEPLADVSPRPGRVAQHRDRDDTTQAALLLFADVRPEPPRRGLPRPGAAGAAEPQGVLACARRRGAYAATRRALPRRGCARDPRARGRPRRTQGRGTSERRGIRDALGPWLH